MFKTIFLEQNSHVPFLGVQLDENLDWSKHISILCNKLSSCCYAIKIMSNIASIETLKTQYFGMFHSKLSYGIIFWGNSLLWDTVFKLQKRAIRNMLHLNSRESCRNHLKNLHILPMPCLMFIRLPTINIYKD